VDCIVSGSTQILAKFWILLRFITIQAKGIMEEIHNSKKRMPLILREDIEKSWLENQLNDFPDVPLNVEVVE
jgi:putative SOS response-associated peptidase YedK